MTFRLKDLGSYRIEQSEDYPEDNAYGEMIRLRGSKPEPPVFMILSHLFKYSETTVGVYFKDHKHLWKSLKAKGFKDVNGHEIDIHDTETIVLVPVARFNEIRDILPLIRKKIRKTPLSDQERERVSHLRSLRKDIMKQNEPKNSMKTIKGLITLDTYGGIKK